MKKLTLRSLVRAAGLAALLAVTCTVSAQTPTEAPTAPPTSGPAVAPGADPGPAPSPDQISYSFGLTFGTQLHNAGIGSADVSLDALSRGLQDALAGKSATPADQQQILAFVSGLRAKTVAGNQAAAKSFLERNGKEKGVITTASGLEYKVLAPGDKKAPAVNPTDQVTVEYRGKLLDGTEFDSSYSRGVPTQFAANGVIKGWQEALLLMKPGAKWQVFIPPNLAYGDTPPRGAKIPGGSLLIFEMTLISATPVAAPTPAGAPTPPKPVTH